MKIYNAVRIPSTDISALIKLGREIGKKNPNYQIIETGREFHHAVDGKNIPVLTRLYKDLDINGKEPTQYEKEASKRAKHALLEQIEFFFQRSANDAYLVSYKEARERFFKELHQNFSEMSDYEIAIIFSIMERIYQKNPKVTFYPGHNHTTLMMWSGLARKTEEWLYAQYQDASYTDSSDGGYILKELSPELDEKLSEFFATHLGHGFNQKEIFDFVLAMVGEKFSHLKDNLETELPEFLGEWFDQDGNIDSRQVEDFQINLRYTIAGVIYEDRGNEWEEVFSGSDSPFGIPDFNGLSMPGYEEVYKNPIWYKTAVCNSVIDCMVNGYPNDGTAEEIDAAKEACIDYHVDSLLSLIEKAYFNKKYVMVVMQRGLIEEEPLVYSDEATMGAEFEKRTGWKYEEEYEDFVEYDNFCTTNLHPESNWNFYDDTLRCYQTIEK